MINKEILILQSSHCAAPQHSDSDCQFALNRVSGSGKHRIRTKSENIQDHKNAI
jgi:hypothetical protein